jgi:topoisomerase (DNA) II binding protein 1
VVFVCLLQKTIERSVPVMTQDWVRSVWDASCKRNVHASDPEFEAYKCPVFHGLTVTCSNLPRQQKEEIRKLIHDNGEHTGDQFIVGCSAYNI